MHRFRRHVALATLCALVACAAEKTTARRAPAPPAASAAVGLSSTELARDLIDGRVGVLFHVERFRFHPAGQAIGRLGRWGEIVEALGLDPLRDVDRAFVASHLSSDREAVNVLELSASDDRVRAGFRALGRDGKSATFELPGGPEVFVALVAPGRLASGPLRLASELWVLGQTLPLPRPEKLEAARFFAFEPYSTLGSPPTWPATLLLAQADIEIERGGGATVRFEAASTSAARATVDAALLTAEARRLLAVDLGLFDLQVLEPPVFHARGDRVVMQTELLATDVDWLLRFSGGP